MTRNNRTPLAPGQSPWDTANGFRAGALAGGLLGGLIGLLTSFVNFWIIGIGAIAGAVIGYWSEKRKQR